MRRLLLGVVFFAVLTAGGVPAGDHIAPDAFGGHCVSHDCLLPENEDGNAAGSQGVLLHGAVTIYRLVIVNDRSIQP